MVTVSEKEVLEVIQKALGLDAKLITIESSVGNINEWDSLGHLGILTALDEVFGGKVANIKDMAKADSVRKILRILKNNSLI
ncbi:MAG TPA: acyl carrier protein [Gammaproteobacteria bacterium]|nr:acyl carrier protein [Gammaproteobacteria bacterium]